MKVWKHHGFLSSSSVSVHPADLPCTFENSDSNISFDKEQQDLMNQLHKTEEPGQLLVRSVTYGPGRNEVLGWERR